MNTKLLVLFLIADFIIIYLSFKLSKSDKIIKRLEEEKLKRQEYADEVIELAFVHEIENF